MGSRFFRVVLMLVGLLAFVGMSGFGAYYSWARWDHSRKWTPTDARVVALDKRCQVQVKRKKPNSDSESWQNDGPEKPCGEVENTPITLLGQPRRVQEIEYVSFTYEAAGALQERRMKRGDISSRRLAEGETFPIFVNPANPSGIDRSLSLGDMLFSGVFVLAGLFLLISTWFFPHLWQRASRRRAGFDIRTT